MASSRFIALTRGISSTLARCELTHLEREPIDVDRARLQHGVYERALEAAGCRLERVPAADELPDCTFVEDTAVVVDELAVVCRPGAESRRTEAAAVAQILERYRPLVFIETPGTVDGGDVLRVGRQVFVGMSTRTNRSGLEQLQASLVPLGYVVTPVLVSHCLHLKTAATGLDDETVLVQRAWLPQFEPSGLRVVASHPEEPFAANALAIGAVVLYPQRFPRTLERLLAEGYDVRTVPADELGRAEAGLTCCSVVFEANRS